MTPTIHFTVTVGVARLTGHMSSVIVVKTGYGLLAMKEIGA
jgi:hypothetical protein